MANGDTGEKTEEATPKKLRDARRKGQVAKSQDLNTAVLLIVAFGVLAFSASFISLQLREFMQTSFLQSTQLNLTTSISNRVLLDALMVMLTILAPFLTVMFISALAIGFFQVGPLFTGHPLMPQLQRLNPITGFKNKFFSIKPYIELAKNTIKIIIVGILIYFIIKGALREIISTAATPLFKSVELVGQLLFKIIVQVSIAFVIIAIADFFFQRYQHKKELRMSKYEVKKEYKEQEGDPTHKAVRKRLHQEIAMYDMIQSVRKADVVIINPVHVAVAIQYDPKNMNAPQVIAKGERLIAEKIKEIAKEYKIPIMRNVPLAHSLMELEIGEEIPEKLYEAVAEVLNFVYKLAEKEKS